MATNHALFFTMDRPREGHEPKAMETFKAMQAFWAQRKEVGDITNVEYVMLVNTGNERMTSGFFLVTGDCDKLQEIRWSNEKFLDLHLQLVVSMEGYACIDGYAGQGFDQHLERVYRLISK